MSSFKKILVTGGTGFIGGRLCEMLSLDYGLPYRVGVRNYAKAPRIARLAPEMVTTDLMNPKSIERALEGCDAVVHLAHSEDHEAAKATNNLLRAALRARVKKFVHISSISVYGPTPGPECATENGPMVRRSGDSYCDAKAEEERLVWQTMRKDGLPGVILRPTVVYGPYSPFVLQVVNSARAGVISLIDEGIGRCNAVYVDDVCGAIHSALINESGLGQVFLVNAAQSISWREFILTFADMVTPRPEMEHFAAEEIQRHWAAQPSALVANGRAITGLLGSPAFHNQLSQVPLFRTLITGTKRMLLQRLSKEKVLALKNRNVKKAPKGVQRVTPWPNPGRLYRETLSVEYSAAHACEVLGWRPAYDFAGGVALTRTWLDFARLLGLAETEHR